MVALVGAALALAGVTAGARLQKLTPAEAATRLSGTWVLNRELTSGFNAPGRRGGGAAVGLLHGSMAPAVGQRGAGPSTASDASDMSAGERRGDDGHARAAAAGRGHHHQGDAGTGRVRGARGQRSYTLDGKNVKVTVAGAEVSTKSRWDKAVLKQEFSTASSKLMQTWDVDENGRLVLVAKVESLRLTTPDQKAVFDKKPVVGLVTAPKPCWVRGASRRAV